MIVPALVYVAFNAGGSGADGWGIPMATDIAMAIGVLSVLGSRVPPQLKLFVLALAIVDDIGAIVVIALFYSDDFDGTAALAATGLLVAMIGLRLLGVRSILPFVVLGTGVWVAIHEGGVHATIAGVVLGLLAPTRPFRHPDMVDADALADVSTVQTAHETVVLARESVSVVEWLEHQLHPWSSYVIVPVFALANAGVVVSSASVDAAAVVTGDPRHRRRARRRQARGDQRLRVAGVPAGVASLPTDTRFSQLVGVAALGGIGFTVSLFISELAFGASSVADEAKLGILAASVTAAALGVRDPPADDTRRTRTGPAEAGPELDTIVT